MYIGTPGALLDSLTDYTVPISGPLFACAKSFGTETHLDKPKLFGKEPNVALLFEMRSRVADGLRWTYTP